MGIRSQGDPAQSYDDVFADTGKGTGVVVPAAAGPFSATGGTKTTPGDGYIYHIFTSSGVMTISGSPGVEMNYVLVGGGGGGGWDRGGGGGGGAFVPGTLPAPHVTTAGAGTFPVSIGSGGTGSTTTATRGVNGGDTSWAIPTPTSPTGLLAKGGGGGGGGPGQGNPPSPSGGSSLTSSGGPSADPFGGSGGGTEGSSWGTTNRGGDSGSYGNPGFKWGFGRIYLGNKQPRRWFWNIRKSRI